MVLIFNGAQVLVAVTRSLHSAAELTKVAAHHTGDSTFQKTHFGKQVQYFVGLPTESGPTGVLPYVVRSHISLIFLQK